MPSLADGIRTSEPYVAFGYDWSAKGGETVAAAATRVIGVLAQRPATPEPLYVLMNWGVNEQIAGLPAEATWETNYYTILDAINAKWPNAKCYLMRPWAQGQDADADTMAGWIATVVTARSAFANLGPDERVWLKGADNGATNTSDGVHYSAAGQTAAVTAWLSTLGY